MDTRVLAKAGHKFAYCPMCDRAKFYKQREILGAKLAIAIEALEDIADSEDPYQDDQEVAKKTLAEIRKDTNEPDTHSE